MATCFAGALLLDSAATGVGCALVAYTILVEQSRRAGVAVIVAGYALIVLAHVTTEGTTLTDLFFNAITFAMVIAIAELMRTRSAYAGIYAERTAQLEAERIAVAQRAVDDERLRIARELHDVVAHAISSIAVQSSVGRERLRTEPDVTEQALEAIESSSRAALSEMRRMLGILRPEGEVSGGLSPAPGLERVDEIVLQSNGSGVTTSLVIDGTRPPAVPPGVDLCAFRIVQEALTNVVKHAPGAHAQVVIQWRSDSIAIDVDDNGHGAGAARPLVGLARRSRPARHERACGALWRSALCRTAPRRWIRAPCLPPLRGGSSLVRRALASAAIGVDSRH